MWFFAFVLLVLVILAIAIVLIQKSSSPTVTSTSSGAFLPFEPNNKAFAVVRTKPLSYKEALRASREFLGRIAKFVLQRFLPQDRDLLFATADKLTTGGVSYTPSLNITALSIAEYQRNQNRTKQQVHSVGHETAV